MDRKEIASEIDKLLRKRLKEKDQNIATDLWNTCSTMAIVDWHISEIKKARREAIKEYKSNEFQNNMRDAYEQ